MRVDSSASSRREPDMVDRAVVKLVGSSAARGMEGHTTPLRS